MLSGRQDHAPIEDEVAEWLRRWTANPMCSARVGSNPILVDTFLLPVGKRVPCDNLKTCSRFGVP
jgi:hypothetical protein